MRAMVSDVVPFELSEAGTITKSTWSKIHGRSAYTCVARESVLIFIPIPFRKNNIYCGGV